MLNLNINQSITFKSIKPDTYNSIYKNEKNHNGRNPDEKIIQTTEKYFPQKEALIADIGAGDGRNAIPIAKLGYKVDAFEISEVGREIICKKAQDMPNLKVLSDDLLSQPLKNTYDEIFLSHVTQHFDAKDMEKSFENLFNSLKQGGILIFDALIDKNDDVEPPNEKNIKNGRSHFKPDFIRNLAEKYNFHVLEIENFKEKASSKGFYFGPHWGFPDICGEVKPKEIALKWFTLKKL